MRVQAGCLTADPHGVVGDGGDRSAGCLLGRRLWVAVRALAGAAIAGGLYLLVAFSLGGFGFGDVRFAPLLGGAAAADSWTLLWCTLLLGTVTGGLMGLLRPAQGRGCIPVRTIDAGRCLRRLPALCSADNARLLAPRTRRTSMRRAHRALHQSGTPCLGRQRSPKTASRGIQRQKYSPSSSRN